ncbi:histone-like protein 18C [Drosophila rhopaloa]|uniref:Histone-like protein 18C n=1 Tax=Drosophila rhopaloa TaxID=1041015 RepID=A0A6P4FFM3_DRORH|nr:histone-like protein 18C [Drosophila rhopaloa]
MSTLRFKDSKTAVKNRSTKKTFEEYLRDAESLKSDIYVRCDGFDDVLAACNSDSVETPYINFLRVFWKRHSDYYTNQQIVQAAANRWNEMSILQRCKYSVNPPKTSLGYCDSENSSTASELPGSSDSDEQSDSDPGTPKATDTFFGGSSNGGGECYNKKKEPQYSKPKCMKPKPSCPKPKSKVKKCCAKPKPKCARPKPACPRPKKRMSCPKPKPRCPKPKSRCAKPKPKCPKPKPSCPK